MFTNSSIHYSKTKTLNAAIVVALTYVTYLTTLVNAQFSFCVDDSFDGNTYCTWAEKPLILYDDITGLGPISFSDNAYLVSICDTGEAFSVLNCDCEIYVQDIASTEFDITDLCNSCTLRSITEFSFALYWDCSNKVTGNCAVFDSNGCQSDDPTPFPVESPTDFPTDPPEDDPTPFPVESPTDFPTDPPEDDPTPFPVESPTDFPTDPPESVAPDDDDDTNPTTRPPVSTPVREPSLRNVNAPIQPPNAAVESENSRSVTTSGGGSSNQYYYHAVGMSSFVFTVLSLVFRI